MEEVKKWNKWDKIALTTISSMHLLALMAPFCFSWSAVLVMVLLVHITGLLGINLSYHRNLSHKSFKFSPKWLEYLFAYFAAHALQGDPLFWVSNHRFHHQYTDTERDPHSPNSGFWYSHISWIFDSANIVEKGVRVVASHHFTWLVNSASHIWGTRSWNTNDLSKNNWWVSIVAFGEGWHNNHHAFQYSARQGLEWWQIDITWYIVKFLEAMGLAHEVKLPNLLQMQKLAIKSM
ncbi:Palmitoyl-monogalactosyldiacylglycerol delta-7 desaturase, chloroplastic [Linum perenne]